MYDDDDSWSEDEWPEEAGPAGEGYGDDAYDDYGDYRDDDAESSTIVCPNCSQDVYEDAELCSHCGYYISDAERYPSKKPTWIVVTTIVCLFIVLQFYLLSLFWG